MTNSFRLFSKSFLATTVCLIILLDCNNGESKQNQTVQSMKKGGSKSTMNSYLIGRFSFDVPMDMYLSTQYGTIRSAEVSEFIWSESKNKEHAREEAFNARLAEVKKRNPPRNKNSAFIEVRDFTGMGKWVKGILYFDGYLGDEVRWEFLVDEGPVGVWWKMRSGLNDPENIKKMIQSFSNVAKAYQLRNSGKLSALPSGHWFNLRYGSINLPYKIRESSKASFYYRPLELRLEIEMNDTHVAEAPEEGLIGRTTAVIATGYAGNVEIERIRSRKRQIAGLKGEEEVDRLSHQGKIELDFGWRYAGEKNSGERPEILITMESPDGNLDEKMKIWDAILDSFKPAYNTAR